MKLDVNVRVKVKYWYGDDDPYIDPYLFSRIAYFKSVDNAKKYVRKFEELIKRGKNWHVIVTVENLYTADEVRVLGINV